MIKFEKDVTKMGMIGAADFVVVLSDPDTCLVRVVEKFPFPEEGYVQVIGLDLLYELYYNELEYPLTPKVVAVGDRASTELGNYRHTKILLNDWRAM